MSTTGASGAREESGVHGALKIIAHRARCAALLKMYSTHTHTHEWCGGFGIMGTLCMTMTVQWSFEKGLNSHLSW